jgi:polyphenol oxidase
VTAGELRADLPGGGVLFSERRDGNMSSVGGEQHERGTLNRELLRARLELGGISRSYQVHGCHVRAVEGVEDDGAEQHELPRADGVLTGRRLLGVGVLTADCLPVALGGPGVVAMLHAGWRGLAGGMLENGVAAACELAGAAERLLAVIGPCAGACCYEVGPEVHEALGAPGHARGPIDLRAIARRRLHAAGIEEIVDVGGCTICDERCFSHRREGLGAGRMMAVAWLS